jgi:two-component system CheB/CheR fusion protein
VWLAEPDGRLHYVSPSFLELLHTDLTELQEKGQFHFLPPETRHAVVHEWAKCRATCGPFNVEYSVRFGDGTDRRISTHGVLSRTHDGLPRWVGVNIDVTQRYAMEDRLRQQAEALREADHRKDEFIALLGHELRNPLAVIHNVLQILSRPQASQADLEESRAMMEKQVSHLTRLVDDLLDVSRFTHGKIQLRKEQVELAATAKHAIECVLPLVDSVGHKLTVSLPAQPVHLEADPTRLEQILHNLLNNAVKYTEPGGNIDLSVEESNGVAIIRVRDNGVGIPAAFLPKLFNLFTQAERSQDRTRGGLGIGLALVRKLVEMHGGEVEAHSEGPGKGSEFVVRLPMLQTD